MKKMQFDVEMNPEQVKQRNELIQSLKKNDVIKNKLVTDQLEMSLLEKYPYKFKQWLEGLKKCEGCKGLSLCKQDNQGLFYDLKYDEFFDFVITPCKYKKKNIEQTSHIKKIVFNYMSEQLKTMSFADLEITADNAEAIEAITNWFDQPTFEGFYIHGTLGVGKSTLVACACNKLAQEGKRVGYIHVPNWLVHMKSIMNSYEEYEKEVRLIQSLDFVVFDDIGAESSSAWSRDELIFPILNSRMENKKWTWFTSNQSFEDLFNHYQFSSKYNADELKALRLMDRVKTLSKELKMLGKNRRRSNVNL